MKSLFIDSPNYFYVEDVENKVIKTKPMRSAVADIIKDSISILESDSDIKIVKVDISGIGLAVAEELEQALKDSSVKIKRYRFKIL